MPLLVALPPPKTFAADDDDDDEGRTGLIVVVPASPKTNVLFMSTAGFEVLLPIDEVLPKTKPPDGLLASGLRLFEVVEPKVKVEFGLGAAWVAPNIVFVGAGKLVELETDPKRLGAAVEL